jgi:acetyl esterase/lipase
MELQLRPQLDLHAIDPDVVELNRALGRDGGVSLERATLEEIRIDRRKRVMHLPGALTEHIDGRGGRIALRMFVPEKPDIACLHFHDGAWSTGAADMQDWLLKLVSEHCNAAVVSADYRLAPESRYPAGPDDAETAALWLSQHAKERFGTDRLVIWGESAGAHLAVVSLLRLRDRHGARPFAAAILNYGHYDLTLTPSARNFGNRPLLINTPIIERFIDFFLPPDIDRRQYLHVSPMVVRRKHRWACASPRMPPRFHILSHQGCRTRIPGPGRLHTSGHWRLTA